MSTRSDWRPGDTVQVPLYGKGTVLEPRNGGRYLVQVKGRSVVVDGRDLRPAVPGRAASAPPVIPQPDDARGERSQPATIDLHGKTVQEALDALGEFLNAAILRGDTHVHVIHGRSGGRVKAAVYARLRQMSAVRDARLSPGNPGLTIVSL